MAEDILFRGQVTRVTELGPYITIPTYGPVEFGPLQSFAPVIVGDLVIVGRIESQPEDFVIMSKYSENMAVGSESIFVRSTEMNPINTTIGSLNPVIYENVPAIQLPATSYGIGSSDTRLPAEWETFDVIMHWGVILTGAGVIRITTNYDYWDNDTYVGGSLNRFITDVVGDGVAAKSIVTTKLNIAPLTRTDKYLLLRVGRDGADVADTFPNIIYMLGVTLQRVS